MSGGAVGTMRMICRGRGRGAMQGWVDEWGCSGHHVHDLQGEGEGRGGGNVITAACTATPLLHI